MQGRRFASPGGNTVDDDSLLLASLEDAQPRHVIRRVKRHNQAMEKRYFDQSWGGIIGDSS